ncbi:MAG: DnaB-like helicase C-terminal domain-containing protein [Candidatus Microgenomates bacterium]|jgi:replicative DNA helicase
MSDFFDIVSKKDLSEKITCGISSIDNSIKGFTVGGNYLLSGPRKSGKSSLLVGFVNHWLSKSLVVGYINSEMDEKHLNDMLQSNFFDKRKDELTANNDMEYKNRFRSSFLYSGPTDIRGSQGISLDGLESEIRRLIKAGAKIIVIDNLTKLQESAPSGTPGYQNLAKGVSIVTTLCRDNNVLGFTVIHTKDELTFTETPEGIAKAVEDHLPEKIFEKSVTILRKPSSSSIYGGGSTKTDLLGTMLLWRPYQFFSDPSYSSLAALIFEDFRGEAPLEMVRLMFDGSKSVFKEDLLEKNIRKIFGTEEADGK